MQKDKVDKGFELRYKNLSYCRRFYRTLLAGIFGILLIPVLILLKADLFLLIFYLVLYTVVFYRQLVENYKKWNEEKKSV